MAFDDLPIERTGISPPGGPRGPRRASPARWIIVIAAIVVAGSLLALWWIVRERQDTAAPLPTTATDVAVASHRPKPQFTELPTLDASDRFLQDMVHRLSQQPMLARLLATSGLIRAAALAVQQIGDGKTPADPLSALRPATRLTILGSDEGRIDPRSYARWDGATNALLSIRANDAAQLYVNVKLLLDQAYRDLGHPNADFDEAIVLAIRTLEATPEVTGDPDLTRHPNFFEHVDPTLRAALPVQKQFILVGPDNRRHILTWLRAFAADLELKLD